MGRRSLLFVLLAVSTACVHPRTFPVLVRHTPALGLEGPTRVVVGRFDGEDPGPLIHLVKKRLGSAETVVLVSRARRQSLKNELAHSMSDLVDPEHRQELGRLVSAKLLLAGEVEQNGFTEREWTTSALCVAEVEEQELPALCVTRHRQVVARVVVGFDLVDIETGENLRPSRFACERTEERSGVEQYPTAFGTQVLRLDTKAPPVDPFPLVEACRHEVTERLLQTLAPWDETILAPFELDGAVPEIEDGVAFAKIGDWTRAEQTFNRGLKRLADAPDAPEIASLARLHLALALTYQYTDRLPSAEAHAVRAYRLRDRVVYDRVLTDIRRARAQGL